MTDESNLTPDILNVITVSIAVMGVAGSILTAYIANRMGQAKNVWRLDALEKSQSEQDKQIQILTKKTGDVEVNMGIIQTSLSGIKEALGRIELNLKDKQDK